MAAHDKKTAAKPSTGKDAAVPEFARRVTAAFTVSAKAAVRTHEARGEKVVGEVRGVWKSSR